LAWCPIAGLVGSWQIGKTTQVKHLQNKIAKPSLYLNLELLEDWFKLEDVPPYFSGHSWQVRYF
jgi:hypothetical protein